MDTQTTAYIAVPGAPDIKGLAFRHFRGDADWPLLADVFNRSRAASGRMEVRSAENLAQAYATMKNFDIDKDLVIAEIDGKVVGYTRIDWVNEADGSRVYWHISFLVPEMRGQGIESALVAWAEERLRAINAELPARPGQLLLSTQVHGTDPDYEVALQQSGYEPVRYEFTMDRPLDDIPVAPMPEGLEARPAKPEHFKPIFDAMWEAFGDHWGAEEDPEEGDFERWTGNPWFQPQLWQVAWDGDQVAGMVLNFVDEEFNRTWGRKRGYTEDISVRRPWRKRGLARALIVRSMEMFKQMGMDEVALGVDTENPNGALNLYESLGYKVTGKASTWRKPLESDR